MNDWYLNPPEDEPEMICHECGECDEISAVNDREFLCLRCGAYTSIHVHQQPDEPDDDMEFDLWSEPADDPDKFGVP